MTYLLVFREHYFDCFGFDAFEYFIMGRIFRFEKPLKPLKLTAYSAVIVHRFRRNCSL
jgi:hypothetical protein